MWYVKICSTTISKTKPGKLWIKSYLKVKFFCYPDFSLTVSTKVDTVNEKLVFVRKNTVFCRDNQRSTVYQKLCIQVEYDICFRSPTNKTVKFWWYVFQIIRINTVTQDHFILTLKLILINFIHFIFIYGITLCSPVQLTYDVILILLLILIFFIILFDLKIF